MTPQQQENRRARDRQNRAIARKSKVIFPGIGKPLAELSRGACIGEDPSLFDSNSPQEKKLQGKSLCNGCPVRSTCLSSALENREASGIWGAVDLGNDEEVRLAS